MSHVSRPGVLISYIGGIKREFAYDRADTTGTSKRAAERARKESDAQVQSAINERALQLYGRKANENELRRGLKLETQKPPQTLSTGRDGLPEVKPGFNARDPHDNFWRRNITDLELRLARAPYHMKWAIQQALNQARIRAEAFDKNVEVMKAEQAKSEAIQDLVALNEGWLQLLAMSPAGEDQEYLEAAQKAHENLLRSGDREAYYAETEAWRDKRKAALDAKIKALEADSLRFADTVERVKTLATETPAENPPAETPAA